MRWFIKAILNPKPSFLINLKNLVQVNLCTDWPQVSMLSFNQALIDEILKINYIFWEVSSLEWLWKIKKLSPDNYSRFEYSYFGLTRLEVDKEEVKKLCFDEFKISSIRIRPNLWTEEFIIIHKLLSSSKTRFWINSIYLNFNMLSECLEILLLCLDCPELNKIWLTYSMTDCDFNDETAHITVQEFLNKTKFWGNIQLCKNNNPVTSFVKAV